MGRLNREANTSQRQGEKPSSDCENLLLLRIIATPTLAFYIELVSDTAASCPGIDSLWVTRARYNMALGYNTRGSLKSSLIIMLIAKIELPVVELIPKKST